MFIYNKEWLMKKKIAHRGIHNIEIIENTLSSFHEAITYNQPIELDIMLTKDNKIIVIHDYNLLRLTGVDREVKDLNLVDIQKLKLINSNETIPTIQEVFNLISGKVPILIEIKKIEKWELMNSILLKLIRSYEGELAIQSFESNNLKWFKEKAKYIPRGIMSTCVPFKYLTEEENSNKKNIIDLEEMEVDFISYDIKCIEQDNVQKYRKKYVLLTWTVKTDKDLTKSILYSDNIIYEDIL